MTDFLNDFERLRRLGDHLMGVGAHAQAAKAYHKAITRFGHDIFIDSQTRAAHLHARMASALLSDDLFLEASPYASEAYVFAEQDPYVRYVHAHMLNAEGGEEALDVLDALALEPSLQPWVSVARAEFDPESVDASVLRGILAVAVEKEPMNGALHTRLSYACERTGHYLEAVQHARIASWLQPWVLRRWHRHGMTAMLANSFSDAAQAFEGARELSPFDPRIDALVARAHLLNGDIDQSAACVLRGLRKDNSQPDCLAVLERLTKYDPHSTSPALLNLESNKVATVEKEFYIHVPKWPDAAV